MPKTPSSLTNPWTKTNSFQKQTSHPDLPLQSYLTPTNPMYQQVINHTLAKKKNQPQHLEANKSTTRTTLKAQIQLTKTFNNHFLQTHSATNNISPTSNFRPNP
jgi:IS1 family transposase